MHGVKEGDSRCQGNEVLLYANLRLWPLIGRAACYCPIDRPPTPPLTPLPPQEFQEVVMSAYIERETAKAKAAAERTRREARSAWLQLLHACRVRLQLQASYEEGHGHSHGVAPGSGSSRAGPSRGGSGMDGSRAEAVVDLTEEGEGGVQAGGVAGLAPDAGPGPGRGRAEYARVKERLLAEAASGGVQEQQGGGGVAGVEVEEF